MMTDVYIEYNKESIYPHGEYAYSPSESYAEYPYAQVSSEENYVYDMVRSCFFRMGYDTANYGTPQWNPLGNSGIIKQGDTVLIKPNWVMHFNKKHPDNKVIASLVTHPSVIRAIVDYVVIALKQSGRIILADAPMQGCNIDEMYSRAGYDPLFAFWKQENIGIEICDLRRYSINTKHGVIVKRNFNSSSQSIVVDIGDKSVHALNNGKGYHYRVSDYLLKDTLSYHNDKNHKYEINKLALEADVIINVPKPKCHRLNGMTGAMKNFVGTVYEKASLPHRIEGDAKNAGDAYKVKSKCKVLMDKCYDKQTALSINNKYYPALFFNFFQKVFYVLGCLITKDKTRVGGWYGNDTIWRTVIDLNYILKHADDKGKVYTEKNYRKMLCIGDMIVCGQRNGPIEPDDKHLGMIMIAEDNMLFDIVLCKIMGFSCAKIKQFSDIAAQKLLGMNLTDIIKGHNVQMNEGAPNTIAAFVPDQSWRFEPHVFWKGHIEDD